ncbi:MAG: thioredoxin fold domain-containing protein [Gammaproteobacteria bacterium]
MRHFLCCVFLLAVSAASADEAAVRATVAELFPNAEAPSIVAAPIPGVFEVAMGTQVFYVSDDGRYFLGGPLVRSASGENLTEVRVAAGRVDVLREDSRVRPFSWRAEKTRHQITVVTDIDCPYCRRLHKDIPNLNAAGIDVNYVMLPRSGKNTPSYHKTVGAACASDPEKAITEAMNGASFDMATCDHPIDTHMTTARELGVSSTPSIVLADGRIVLGQKSPEALLKLIEQP